MTQNSPFTKREVCAMMFAAALVSSRDAASEYDARKTNAAVMRDAFTFADAFLMACEEEKFGFKHDPV